MARIAFALLFVSIQACSGSDSSSTTGPGPSTGTGSTDPDAHFELGSIGGGRIAFERILKGSGFLYQLDGTTRTSQALQLTTGNFTTFSPDGTRYFTVSGGFLDNIVLRDRSGGQKVLIADQALLGEPRWSRDSKTILFPRARLGNGEGIQIDVASGVTSVLPISQNGSCLLLSSISQSLDGTLYYVAVDQGSGNTICGQTRLYSVRPDGTDRRVRLSGDTIGVPTWSPDDSQAAMLTRKSGPGNSFLTIVMVMQPDFTHIRRVAEIGSNNEVGYGGTAHRLCWSADGSRLLFTVPDARAVAHVYSVKPDGSELIEVTTGEGYDSNLSCFT